MRVATCPYEGTQEDHNSTTNIPKSPPILDNLSRYVHVIVLWSGSTQEQITRFSGFCRSRNFMSIDQFQKVMGE